jgi:23S rRNA (cytosine1962-C5)-methyltransferase
VFRVENDFGELAALAAQVLAPGGWLLCCTNFRGMTSREFERQLSASLPRPMPARHAPMPPDFTDRAYLKSVWLE